MTKTEMNMVMALDRILGQNLAEKHSFNGVSEDKWDERLKAIEDKKRLLKIFKSLDIHPSHLTEDDYDRLTNRMRRTKPFRYV
jgi:hypothetical protein